MFLGNNPFSVLFIPSDYPDLRDHFEADHFLCLEGPCENEQFTHAFRSEIDLKAHRADRHAGGLSKSEIKQNRTISGLDFNYSRPTANGQVSRRRGLEADLTPVPDQSDASLQLVDQIDGPVRPRGSEEPPAPEYSADNFPSLGGGSGPGNSRAGSVGPGSLASKVCKETRTCRLLQAFVSKL